MIPSPATAVAVIAPLFSAVVQAGAAVLLTDRAGTDPHRLPSSEVGDDEGALSPLGRLRRSVWGDSGAGVDAMAVTTAGNAANATTAITATNGTNTSNADCLIERPGFLVPPSGLAGADEELDLLSRYTGLLHHTQTRRDGACLQGWVESAVELLTEHGAAAERIDQFRRACATMETISNRLRNSIREAEIRIDNMAVSGRLYAMGLTVDDALGCLVAYANEWLDALPAFALESGASAMEQLPSTSRLLNDAIGRAVGELGERHLYNKFAESFTRRTTTPGSLSARTTPAPPPPLTRREAMHALQAFHENYQPVLAATGARDLRRLTGASMGHIFFPDLKSLLVSVPCGDKRAGGGVAYPPGPDHAHGLRAAYLPDGREVLVGWEPGAVGWLVRYRIDGEPWVVSGIYTDEILNRSKVGRMGRLIDWMLNEKIKLELLGAGSPVG